MGRARRRGGSLQHSTRTQIPLGWVAQILRQGKTAEKLLKRKLCFQAGLMRFITALQLAGMATGDNHHVEVGKIAVVRISSSLPAGSPLPSSLASASLFAPAPSSAGSLRVDPAVPTQSIQHGAQPPALGRIIIRK
uniref:Uncharacterized protein n=1 Tax=Bubo bubo TaxID=30461 RepID=A0A8C0ELZ7_BUBBB